MMTTLLLAVETVTNAPVKGDAATGFCLLAIGLLALVARLWLWLLPGFVASKRKHPNRMAIWVVTLLLGWSFPGLVVALVWAFTNPQTQVQTIVVTESA